MNNNDLSLINLSEIRFLTGDTGERENADAMMQERGLLTDKGNRFGYSGAKRLSYAAALKTAFI